MPGVGKSVTGRRLAAELSMRFVDLDEAIVDRCGQPIPELFARFGEAGFREMESAELLTVLDDPDRLVISTGGGVVLAASNRAALRERSSVVWLRASAPTLVERLAASSTRRPTVEGDVVGNVARLLKQRTPLYAEVAGMVVDVDRAPVLDVVDDVLARVGASVAAAAGAAADRNEESQGDADDRG
jgi:shikimate kinase